MDKDLTLSLKKIATSSQFKDVNFFIGNIPFYAHYFPTNQLIVYNRLFSKEGPPIILSIDATGGICNKIEDNKRIFLYQGVVFSSDNTPSLPVCQMLSSQHDGLSIKSWLERWQMQGAKTPHIIVCDASKALLIAAVGAFTESRDIMKYIDELFECARTCNDVKVLIYLYICHLSLAVFWKQRQQKI